MGLQGAAKRGLQWGLRGGGGALMGVRACRLIFQRCELKPVNFSAVRIKTGSFFSGAN